MRRFGVIAMAGVSLGVLGLLAGTAKGDKPCPTQSPPSAPQGIVDAGPAVQQILTGTAPDALVAADSHWIHGQADCSTPQARQPLIQMVQVDADTYVMRQNMCTAYEAPFMYLYCGNQKCVLMDTGDAYDPADLPLRDTVDRILTARAAANHLPQP
ncbi:MAG TPA: hypothetical protein VL588_03205, partial [Bdellovibrionota bacterium]|nr:hypothetical protein [Bdellovibrionota bacterium]